MTIAIASADGREISPHFGRSPYFLVFSNVDGQVRQTGIRKLESALGKENHNPGDGGHEGHHDHSQFVNLLSDCEAVISRGMGHRAAVELTQFGIKPYVVSGELSPQEAAAAYFQGALAGQDAFCQCHD
jgi:predicted Fe-Mo cluster-binding NifX family protein